MKGGDKLKINAQAARKVKTGYNDGGRPSLYLTSWKIKPFNDGSKFYVVERDPLLKTLLT